MTDHLVTHPDRWHRLAGDVGPADADGAAATMLAAVGADPDGPPAGSPGGSAARSPAPRPITALRAAYRDEIMALAAADLAAIGEPGLPVMEIEDVTARLSDLATAALRAALAVAVAEVGRRGAAGSPSSPWASAVATS